MKKGTLLVGILLMVAYLPIWHWMVGRWMAPGSYYSHGFLIPLMSGYLIWKERKRFILNPDEGRRTGLLLVIAGLLFFLLSAFWQVYFTGGWSFLIVLFGSMVYLYGWKPFKILWFPFVFLAFMIPIPLVLVADISLQLKLFAAGAAIRFIDAIGIVAVGQGSYIHLPTGTMIVGDICSGLRSLIALLAFGAFFSFISRLSSWKKAVLFLSSIPIAWIANIIRIIALCLIANSYGIDAASGFVHDASGILIFVVAFILLFAFEKILRVTGKKKGETVGRP